MPKISVIVPIYNVEEYLDRCVSSILSQTFTDFDLVLIDDGSPDNCPKICDEWAKKDGRIHVIHQQNGGLSAARNAGIDWVFANSDSEWLTFIDSDDYLYEGYLDVLLNAVLKCDTRISTCNATQEDFCIKEEDFIPHKYSTEYAYCDNDILRHRITAWCKLFHKSLWVNERFPVGKLHEDRYLIHRILFKESEIATVIAQMYFVTPNPTSISNSKWTPRRLDHIEAVEQELAFFHNSPYRKAELRTALSAIYVFIQTIGDVKHSDQSIMFKLKYSSLIRHKLRKLLSDYSTQLSLNDENNTNIYLVAYPIKTKLVILFKIIWKKVKLK